MKCIYCQTDSKYPDRQKSGARCGKCGHPFAFEPKSDTLNATPISDGLFNRAVQDVSGGGKLFFTERQLWYEFCRRLRRKQAWHFTSGGCAVTAACVLVGLCATLVTQQAWLLLGLIAGVGGGLLLSRRERLRETPAPAISFDDFRNHYLRKWTEAHGAPERLVPTPKALPEGEKREVDPELTAYSFDRALVTERADTAAMLVANNFHFENNCAILSLDGYPEEIRDTLMTMLRRNPRLKVFALHDATAEGCALPLRLRGVEWFPDTGIQVIDLGLRPKHAKALKLFTTVGPAPHLSPDVRTLLDPEEIEWLEAGNHAGISAIRPERLMRSIYQGFARSSQVVAAAGAAGDWGPGYIWFYDSGADVYAADSFG